MKKSDCIDAWLACVVTCEKCITDCVKDHNVNCAYLCRDCADVCALCARLEARNSPYCELLCGLCAKMCKACAEECTKHAAHHQSCKECADACNKCAEVCTEFAGAMV